MPLNPASFPRPPLLERISKRLLVQWPTGQVIADTTRGYWVLETHHAPSEMLIYYGLGQAYYIPPEDVKVPLSKTPRSTYCEWKGAATYFSIPDPSGGTVDNRVWTYEKPSARFKDIKDYICFYNGPWECYVDEEKAQPQPGDFYGGWVTSEIQGTVKGGPGTWGW